MNDFEALMGDPLAGSEASSGGGGSDDGSSEEIALLRAEIERLQAELNRIDTLDAKLDDLLRSNDTLSTQVKELQQQPQASGGLGAAASNQIDEAVNTARAASSTAADALKSVQVAESLVTSLDEVRTLVNGYLDRLRTNDALDTTQQEQLDALKAAVAKLEDAERVEFDYEGDSAFATWLKDWMPQTITQRVEFDWSNSADFKAYVQGLAPTAQSTPLATDDALDEFVRQRVDQLIAAEQDDELSDNYRGSKLIRDGKTQQFVGSASSYASMFVASNDVATLYLGVLKDGEEFSELEPRRFNMTEWVKLGTGSQSDAYLKAFGRFGLKEYGTIIWSLHENAIASYLIQNVDGSTFMSGATNEA